MPRLTFDVNYLETGIGLVPVLLGVFVVSEIFVQIADRGALGSERMLSKKSDVARRQLRYLEASSDSSLPVMAKSTGMGTIIGMLPGVGASAACFRRLRRGDDAAAKPEDRWGKGEIKGVAAAEAANNSVSGANIIPLLTLGIPGSVAAALLGGVFLIHGMNIGPKIFVTEQSTIYGLFASGLLCIATYFVMGYWGSGIIGKIIAKVPVRVIYPFIFITSIVAVYALRNTLFDVGMMCLFGFVGYFFKKFDYSLPAFIIAFILGPGAERALRQALLLSQDGAMIFLERPLAILFILIAVLVIGVRIYQTMRQKNAGEVKMAE